MDVKSWIKKDEGLRLLPYKCTADKLTIGYGRNLQDNGISAEEAEYLLDNDIKRVVRELSHFDWFTSQPQHVREALINLCFNIGLTRLLGFKRMIAALIAKDYKKAADEALDSKWATQVPNRAKELASVMRGEK